MALTVIVKMAAILIYIKTVEAKMKESKKLPKKPYVIFLST